MDFGGVPVVDNHAHPLTRLQPATGEAFRACFAESHSPLLARDHLPSAVYYRWTLRQLADELGTDPTDEGIVNQRAKQPFSEYARGLIFRANIGCLLLDDGYPPRHQVFSAGEMGSMLGIPVRRLLRIESLVQDLLAARSDPGEVVGAFDERLTRLRDNGYVGLKSIAAYRTGLAIEPVDDDDLDRALASARQIARTQGFVRLESKSLIDYFVIRALGRAADEAIPFQFHTGYGDPDLDLRMANPLHLRPLFEDPRLRGAPIVLLHASYPFTAEAAYLAAVYPNAYLDVAFCLPPLDRLQLVETVKTALGVAPASKLMASSDGVGIPEHYWLGAVRARAVLSQALTAMVEAGELGDDDAQEIGELFLQGNATRVYGLSGVVAEG